MAKTKTKYDLEKKIKLTTEILGDASGTVADSLSELKICAFACSLLYDAIQEKQVEECSLKEAIELCEEAIEKHFSSLKDKNAESIWITKNIALGEISKALAYIYKKEDKNTEGE